VSVKGRAKEAEGEEEASQLSRRMMTALDLLQQHDALNHDDNQVGP
jgi:hypothetical protein